MEVIPHAVVAELELGAALEIAGEEAEQTSGARQRVQERLHAGKEPALDTGELLREVREIALHQP